MPAQASVQALFDQEGNATLIEDDDRYPRNAGVRVITKKSLPIGSTIVAERGAAVAIVNNVCPVSFGSHESNTSETFLQCQRLAKLLQPVEGVLLDESNKLLELHPKIDPSIASLWLRLCAIACIPGEGIDDDCRYILDQWRIAISAGLSHQQASAPTQDWLIDMALFAQAYVDMLPDAILEHLADLILPPLQRSGSVGHDSTVNEALVMIAGQLNRNGYSLRHVTDPNRVVAHGIFPAIAMLNHSCMPNCVVVTEPYGILAVRTIRPLAAGTECFVSYVDLLLPQQQRIDILKTNKEFVCTCLRCIEPNAFPREHTLTSIRCPFCQTTVLKKFGDGYVCYAELGGCGHVVSEDEVLDARQTAVGVLHDLSAQQDASEVEAAIVTAAKTLPLESKELQKAHLLAFRLYAADNNWSEAASHIDQCIAGMQPLLPDIWPELHQLQIIAGNSWAQASMTDNGKQSQARSTARARLKAALAIKKVCSAEHPMVVKIKETLEALSV
eukprot:TRINITY_DN7897_c0_g1_i2.p1 TRINITY_DN7897_c0_g1~~TRINITY_DN7897_c0_g1_i2.p1  ORF type:complete len:508 (+),score=104.82 TRINITY_DN7897_c0_g1_i2:22-1524(+)